jgi:hypothetical protein
MGPFATGCNRRPRENGLAWGAKAIELFSLAGIALFAAFVAAGLQFGMEFIKKYKLVQVVSGRACGCEQ